MSIDSETSSILTETEVMKSRESSLYYGLMKLQYHITSLCGTKDFLHSCVRERDNTENFLVMLFISFHLMALRAEVVIYPCLTERKLGNERKAHGFLGNKTSLQ